MMQFMSYIENSVRKGETCNVCFRCVKMHQLMEKDLFSSEKTDNMSQVIYTQHNVIRVDCISRV